MENKVCCQCKVLKPLSAFYKRTKSPDGLAYICKKCAVEYVITKFIKLTPIEGKEDMNNTVMCMNGHRENALEIKGLRVCTATHPDNPNFSGHSRGRKIHLAKDAKKTICNMLVDEYVPASDTNWSPVSNGQCKSCFK